LPPVASTIACENSVVSIGAVAGSSLEQDASTINAGNKIRLSTSIPLAVEQLTFCSDRWFGQSRRTTKTS
jgi:hypothetical protein